MRTIKVLQGQSLFDIAIQELGTVLGVMDIGKLNDLSITEVLTPGQEIVVPDSPLNTTVYNYYKKNNIKPATAFTDTTQGQLLFEPGLFEAGLFE